MGVNDSANLVKDNDEKTRRLLLDIGNFIIIPAFLNIDRMSIIMGKNVAKGLGLDYHVMIYLATEGYGIPLDDLWGHFNWIQMLRYFWAKVLFGFLYTFVLFRRLWNFIFISVLHINIKRARNMTFTNWIKIFKNPISNLANYIFYTVLTRYTFVLWSWNFDS